MNIIKNIIFLSLLYSYSIFTAFGYSESNTVFLSHFDGTNKSVTFIESSIYHKPILSYGGHASLSTNSVKMGTTSANFDGAGDDYIYYPISTDYQFGAEDFTIDCWANQRVLASGENYNTICTDLILTQRGWGFILKSDVLYFYYSVNGSSDDRVTAPYTFIANTWYHVAVTRSGRKFYLFVNGNVLNPAGTQFDNFIYAPLNAPLTIGRFGDYTASTHSFNGYIDELRIIKGKALWTTNFVPESFPYIVEMTNSISFTPVNNSINVYPYHSLSWNETGTYQYKVNEYHVFWGLSNNLNDCGFVYDNKYVANLNYTNDYQWQLIYSNNIGNMFTSSVMNFRTVRPPLSNVGKKNDRRNSFDDIFFNYRHLDGGIKSEYYDSTGRYLVYTFTNSDVFTVKKDVKMDVLILAGGGGGGIGENSAEGDGAGGGGAGGLLYLNQTIITSGVYSVTVGEGGNGSVDSAIRGFNGSNSVFASFVAFGGGGGGSDFGSLAINSGADGGSGGGAASYWSGLAYGGNAVENQGNMGSLSSYNFTTIRNGCGGGGAGDVGKHSSSTGGAGGIGQLIKSKYYAGGGGGGQGGRTRDYLAGGIGGLGGGGNGASYTVPAGNGVDGLGGGGGGGSSIINNPRQIGGNGGKGVVIFYYKIE